MTWKYDKLFDAAFAKASMLEQARVAVPGGGVICFSVSMAAPTNDRLNGMVLSRDYEIEYRTDDVPGLERDDEIEIVGDSKLAGLYRVRSDPFVPGDGVTDGYWMRATLTRKAD